MGRILIYGMGGAPDSECSSDDSELDSEDDESAASYDFIEEGIFDSLMAMHIRVGTTMYKDKKEPIVKSNEMETLNSYQTFLSKLPALSTLIQNASKTMIGRWYLNSTMKLSSVFIQLFELLSYVPVDDMINVRRVATLLRGFAVWCTVLDCFSPSLANVKNKVNGLYECIQKTYVNEKWQGLDEKYSLVDVRSHPNRNGLRQVRIPRKSKLR